MVVVIVDVVKAAMPSSSCHLTHCRIGEVLDLFMWSCKS
jgi:hypothetical protein